MPYSSSDSLSSSSCSSIDTQVTTSDPDISHDDVATSGSESPYSSDDDNYSYSDDHKGGRSSISSNSSSSSSISSSSSSSISSSSSSSSNVTNIYPSKGRSSKDFTELTSVQMEVTARLLESERRRLAMLSRDLELRLADSGVSQLEIDINRDTIRRVHLNYVNLDEEYQVSCRRALIRRISMPNKPSRSQPYIGVKQIWKPRLTIFDTLAQTGSVAANSQTRESADLKMLTLAQMFGSGSGYVASNNGNHTDMHRHQDTLIFQNGNLHSGTLEALIQHLMPTSDYYPDRTYTFAFLLSSRLFVRPHELLAQVCQIGELEQGTDQGHHRSLDKLGHRIVSLLSDWIDMFPYDFRDDRMMRQLREITQLIITTNPELRKDVSNLSYNLMTKLTSVKSYEESLARIETQEQHKAQRQHVGVAATDITEVCPRPLLLAQQLTHIELQRLSMIGPEEFVQALCTERAASGEISSQDMKTTHNLEAYIQWFNRLSYMVASEITSHWKNKKRVKVVEYFIDVAKECINIGNFNSLMAIIAGMNLSPVARLKKMWTKVNRDKLKILEHQMDPSNNFRSYRSCLKVAMWRSEGAVDDREKIVIPFFSLFVKDLYFLNEGCCSKQEDGSVNFQKCWQMAKQISDLLAWQQVECPFDKCPTLIDYLLTRPIYTESMLSMASYECETPETSYDREKYKQLKSQTSLTSS